MSVTASDKRRQQGDRDETLLSLEKLIFQQVDGFSDPEDNIMQVANGKNCMALRGQRAIHVTHRD